MTLAELFLKAGFPEDRKSLLDKYIQKKNLNRGEYFTAEGSTCNEIAFIEKGMVKHFYNTPGGEVTRWVSMKGSLLSSFKSFIMQVPGNENIMAISPVTLSILSLSNLNILKKEIPEVQGIWSYFVEQYCAGLEDRLYHLIAFDAQDNYRYLLESYPDMIKNVPTKYIASILGIEPRHLSRIKATLS
jgi:CRP-like cAMP-binding protein